MLTDAARECREIGVEIVSDRTIGLFCVRDVAPAARILNRLAREWHVRADGKTIVGPWATLTPIAERFDLVAFDGSAGRAELATEALASFTPGRSFTSPMGGGAITIGAVTHTLSGSSVRTEVLAAEVRP